MLAVALVYTVNERGTWRQLLVKDGCTPAEELTAAVEELHGRKGCEKLTCFLDELLQRAGHKAVQHEPVRVRPGWEGADCGGGADPGRCA